MRRRFKTIALERFNVAWPSLIRSKNTSLASAVSFASTEAITRLRPRLEPIIATVGKNSVTHGTLEVANCYVKPFYTDGRLVRVPGTTKGSAIGFEITAGRSVSPTVPA